MIAPPVQLAAASWRLENPAALLLLLAVPPAAGLLWLAFARQRRALRMLAGAPAGSSAPSALRAGLRIVLVSLGLSALIGAIARPQADPVEETVKVRGRDIVFLVDVSRSMLSRDVAPSRLGRTKLWINDLVNTLRGDRIALVAFAGVAVVKCPLTLDQGFFRMELDDLSPASVPRGGTLIGDAIRKSLADVFEPNPGRFRDIILITDGEDQGSFPVEAAKAAGEAGVRLIAIGIGGELEGAPVPSDERGGQSYIVHEGAQVRSRLDSGTLASVAEACRQSGGGGVFLNVGTGTMDLDKVYHDLIASAEQRETDNKTSVTYRELFPWFIAFAAACLGIEPLIGTRAKVRARPAPARSGPAGSPAVRIAAAALAGAVVLGLGATPLRADDAKPAAPSAPSPVQPVRPPTPGEIYNTGRELFAAGKFAQAAEHFRAADQQASDPALSNKARFNLGQALLKQATNPPPAPAEGGEGGDAPQAAPPPTPLELLDAAARAFRSARAADPSDREAARNVEIARRLMQEIREQEQQQGQSNQDQDKKDQNGKDQQGKDGKSEKNGKDGKDPEKQSADGKSPEQQQAEREAQRRQQNADELKQLAKEQQEAAEKSGQAQQQKDEEARREKTGESKRQQDQVNQQTEQAQRKQQESGAQGDAKAKTEQARTEQQQATEALEKGDPQAAQEHQQKAAELLEQAASDEAKAAEQARRQAQQAKAKDDKAKEEKPKYDQQAAQMLDKERRQREARQQILRALRGKAQPVEKDW